MRDFLKSSGRWLSTGWFWPLVLLALPNCTLNTTGLAGNGRPPAFDPGPAPITSTIMCDIPKVDTTQCATAAEAGSGISVEYAAVALAQGEQNTLGLDFSQAATNACGGLPMRTEFHGPFPDGFAVCLNCGTQIPAVHAGATAVCVAKCKDLLNFGESPTPAQGVDAFCEANARPSTNFNKDTCYENACSNGGTPDPNFVDPRRTSEQVIWGDLTGTSAVGNSLTREADQTGQNSENFDAGAASSQLITHGDGWVEFEASEGDKSHVLGLMSINCFDCGAPGLLDDILFAISLNKDGNHYVIEGGDLQDGPGINDSFGPYAVGERYRVRFTDKHNGTAGISYWRLDGPCTPGTVCNEEFIADQEGSPLSYPFRVGAAFREQFATLANVTIVRIIE